MMLRSLIGVLVKFTAGQEVRYLQPALVDISDLSETWAGMDRDSNLTAT